MKSIFALLRLAIVFLFFFGTIVSSYAQSTSNLRRKTLFITGDTLFIDTLSIVPNSVAIPNIPATDYHIDYSKARLSWIKKPDYSSIEITYRVMPLLLGSPNRHLSFDSVMNRFLVSGDKLTGKLLSQKPFDFGKVKSNGSLGRSLSFGNKQDAVLNSSLNLQLNGYIGDSILLAAAISDNNIPIQPDGNTQNLNEFDQIYIQFSKDKWKLSLGDLDIRQRQMYFLNFYKRLQGVSYESENRLSDNLNNKILVSGAIAKGKFTRNVFQGVEGNQGPYRLKGANQELFFIVLAGTERVFIDGVLMQRGEDQDYIINYNTAEVTFMPRQMISKDKRIQIEFEYADRNYLNSQIYLNNRVEVGKNLNMTVGYFANNDAKNSPINQTLNTSQKQFLSSVGDRVNSAFYPSAMLDTFAQGKVLYRKVDTLYAANLRDTIYVYENENNGDLFSLSFSDVGEGLGSYILDPRSGANGKVYAWVAPDSLTGQKKGRYEPVVLLVAPKKQQVISIGTEWSINEHTQLLTDLALSKFDINRLSSKDKSNDDGIAGRMIFNNKMIVDQAKQVDLKTEVSAEFTSATFKPVERLRSVEFSRDWGLDLVVAPADERILQAGFSLEQQKIHRLAYTIGSYGRDRNFDAIRHNLEHNINQHGWRINNTLGITSFKDHLKQGYFFRPIIDMNKSIPALANREFGIKYTTERTASRFISSDSITPGSFSFNTFQISTVSNPSRLNKWGLMYFTRSDEVPFGKELIRTDRSHNFNVNTELMSNDHHQFKLNATYRKLDIINNVQSNTTGNSLLGRAEYFTDIWKGAITANTLYELGSGQEPRREFSYFEVPAGQGEYTWIDYNNDGVQQINEFEVAKFRDQGKYFRIFTPTNEFIRSNYLQFNYNLVINPSVALAKSPNGNFLIAILRRLYFQSALQSGQKQLASGSRNFNPFSGLISDTSLLTFDQIQSHTFSYNKFSQVWGIDLNYLQSSNKAFLSFGYETRRMRDLSVKLRSNWFKMLTLDLIARGSSNILQTPSFGNRNFNIKGYAFEPRLTFTQRTRLRLIGSFKEETKRNALTDRAIIRSFNLEGKYNIVSTTSVNSRFTLSNIQFNGQPASSVGYIMLDGLQPGRNFIWTIDITKRLSSFLELGIQYEGRRAGSSGLVNIGRAQVRAIL
ncbi:MAG: hypothetical protein ACK5AO_00365 [bacterium]